MSTSETRDRIRHPLTILITQIGTLQGAPIAVAVLTTNFALTGFRTLLELMKRDRRAPARRPSGHTARRTRKVA